MIEECWLFCKGYYPRIANNKMNGRVARLLVGPLLTALEKTIGQSDYLKLEFYQKCKEAFHQIIFAKLI